MPLNKITEPHEYVVTNMSISIPLNLGNTTVCNIITSYERFPDLLIQIGRGELEAKNVPKGLATNIIY